MTLPAAWLLAAAAASCLPPAPPSAATPVLDESNGILVRLSESDLNRMLPRLLGVDDDGTIHGYRERVSDRVYDLSYTARLTRPVVDLSDGAIELSVSIVDADVRVGRIEGEIVGRRAHCEGAGLATKDGKSLDVSLRVGLTLREGALTLAPLGLTVDDPRRDLRLIKPDRCERLPLPKWFLWWVGKSRLKRWLSDLDQMLLERVEALARDLSEQNGLLTYALQVDSWIDPDVTSEVELRVGTLQLDDDALLLGVSASSGRTAPGAAEAPPWTETGSDGSFIAISESFVNAALKLAFAGGNQGLQRPTGDLDRLFRSGIIYALIPGIRDLPRNEISFSLAIPEAPEFRFSTVGIDRAAMGLELRGVKLGVWHLAAGEAARELGTLRIDRADVQLAPYVNVVGGISFELLRNEWEVSSTGIGFNEEAFAAALQELLFAEAFGTSYNPLAREGVGGDDLRFQPRGFRVVGGYLVVELDSTEPTSAPVAQTKR